MDGEAHTRTILARTVLRQATDEIVEVGTRNVGIGTGEFAVPLNSYTFTSAFKYRWGRLHGGVDLAVDEGTPVYAADNGKVIVAEDSGNAAAAISSSTTRTASRRCTGITPSCSCRSAM